MLIAIVIGIVVGMISGFYCCFLAEEKGYSRTAWGWGGFFFGIFALIAVAGLPDRIKDEREKKRFKGIWSKVRGFF